MDLVANQMAATSLPIIPPADVAEGDVTLSALDTWRFEEAEAGTEESGEGESGGDCR